MKNIIFDLGSVLLKNKASSTLDNLNLDDETKNELKRFFEDTDDLDLGLITLEKKFDECNFSEELTSKYKDYLVHYHEHRKINMDLVNLINRLKENGYTIYVISEINSQTLEYYKKLDAFKNIDFFLGSCEYHALKKDGTLFDIFIEKYNVTPSECYFIDDKEINVSEARKRDIVGFVFDENKDISLLYDDMRKYGINT